MHRITTQRRNRYFFRRSWMSTNKPPEQKKKQTNIKLLQFLKEEKTNREMEKFTRRVNTKQKQMNKK